MSNFAESYVQILRTLPSINRKTLLSELDSENLQLVAQHVILNLLPRSAQEALVSIALNKLTQKREERADENEATLEPVSVNSTARPKNSFEPSSPRVNPYPSASTTPRYVSTSPSLYNPPQSSPNSLAYVPKILTRGSQKRSAPLPHHTSMTPPRHPTSPLSPPYGSTPAKLDLTSPTELPSSLQKRPRTPNVNQASKRIKNGKRRNQWGIASTHNPGVAPHVEPSASQEAVKFIDLDPSYVPSDDDDGDSVVQEGVDEDTDTDDSLSVASQERLKLISELKIILYLRVVTTKFGVGPSHWYESAASVPKLNSLLQRKFKKDFLSTHEARQRCDPVLKRPVISLHKYRCMAVYASSVNMQYRCQYLISDGKTGYTCDYCIENRRLCVRPAIFKGDTELVVHPLPRKLRIGVPFEDKLYWVREKPDKVASD